jgi:thioredoxin 1
MNLFSIFILYLLPLFARAFVALNKGLVSGSWHKQSATQLKSTVDRSVHGDKTIRELIEGVVDLSPVEDVMSIKEISDSTFVENVIQSKGLAVCLFTSSWCSPCRDMRNTILSEVLPKFKATHFLELNTDYNCEAVAELGVRSIPSVLLFKDGQLVSDIVGNVAANVLNEQITKHSQDF